MRWLFWDNDGVLVDTEDVYYRASAEVLAGVGIQLSREEFAEISLRQGGSVFTLADGILPSSQVEALRRERDSTYSRLLRQGVKTVSGVEETLRALHGLVRMAIVTSCRREHFEIIHRDSGLLKYFEFVLTREEYSKPKPHPEAYLAALTRSGSHAEECLVIEDSPRGLAAALEAGLKCLVVPGPFFPADQFAGGHLLTDIREAVPLALGPAGIVSFGS